MAFCTFCGGQVDEKAQFCGNCGAKIAKEEPQFTPTYQTQTYETVKPAVSKKNSIFSLVFGVVSVFCAVFSWYPFFILTVPAIIFLCLAKSKRNKYVEEAGEENGFAKAGRILSTVAIPLTAVLSIFSIYFFVGLLSIYN